VHLTQIQYDILNVLMSHAGQVLSRAQIMDQVWGHTIFSDPDHLSVHIHHLRVALGDPVTSPTWLHTVRGIGYMYKPTSYESRHKVTLHFTAESVLRGVRPHAPFLRWNPDDIVGRFFSLAGLDAEDSAAMLAALRRSGGMKGSIQAHRGDGSHEIVDVVIELGTPCEPDGYQGHVHYGDGSPSTR